jgi:hypothetical protein
MTKRSCMFCGGPKLTSAHLISRSLQALLPDFDATTRREDMWFDAYTEDVRHATKVINVNPANHQVKRLCHECNGQWMASLEADTRDLLVALSRGDALSLADGQQLVLSTWATVVCMLRATQDPGLRMVSDKEVSYVRTRNAPPPGFMVWLIRGEHRPDVVMRHFRAQVDEQAGWFGWIWIGEVVLAVSSRTLSPHTQARLNMLPSAAVQIHPSQKVDWPPTNSVEFYTLYELMKHQ